MSTVAGACLLASAAAALGRTQQRKKHCTVLRATAGKIPLEDLSVGQEVDGEVSRVANIGVWINIGAEKDALLPKTELKGKTYTPREKITGLRITEVQAGDTPAERKIRVTRSKASTSVQVDDILDGKVTNATAFGVFFDCGLDSDILVPKGDLAESDKDLQAGDARKVKVVMIENGKITGSTDTSAKAKVQASSLKVGDVVTGKVTTITDFGVFVSFGGTKDALCREGQLEKGITEYKSGDTIEGLRVASVDLEKNQVQLSMRKLPSECSEGDKLEGTVSSVQGFGIFFDAGLAFDVLCPNTMLAKNKEDYTMGEIADLTIKGIEGNRITVTAKDGSSLANIIPGSQVTGTIKGVNEKFGLFIDAGLGTDAFLPLARLPKPIGEYKTGDPIEGLVVLNVNVEKEQIELMTMDAPAVSGRPLSDFKVGEPVAATVTRVAPFGVFVDVGAERDALYATSQLEQPIGEYKEGMKITGLRISDVDVDTRRLAVSKKKTVSEFSVDEVVPGKVTKKMTFGCFVDIGAAVDALLPLARMDKELDEYIEGQELSNLKVTSVDVGQNRLAVAQKERVNPSLLGASEQVKIEELTVGEKRKGVVRMVREYGIFIDIGLGRKDALMPKAVLGSKSTDDFESGQSLEVYIARVDRGQERVTLSLEPPPEGGFGGVRASMMKAGTEVPPGMMLPDPECWKTESDFTEEMIDDEPFPIFEWAEKYPGLIEFAEKPVELYYSPFSGNFEGIEEISVAREWNVPIPVHLRSPDAKPPVVPPHPDPRSMTYDYGIKNEIHIKYRTPPLNDPNWIVPDEKRSNVEAAKRKLEAERGESASSE